MIWRSLSARKTQRTQVVSCASNCSEVSSQWGVTLRAGASCRAHTSTKVASLKGNDCGSTTAHTPCILA
eukprot:2912081-Amphidinium_carterae.2